MSRELIVMPNWLGDYLMALSIVSKMDTPSGHLRSLLSPPYLIELTTLLAPQLSCIPYDRSSKSAYRDTLKRIRQEKFDRASLLPYSFSSAWTIFRTGIRVRRGLSKDGRGLLLTSRLPGSLRDRSRHILEEFATILEQPFRSPEEWSVAPPIELLQRYQGAIVLCPGAKFGPSKRWPGFENLPHLLPDTRFVVIGSKGDGLQEPRMNTVTDLTGKTSLTQAAAILAGATAVVSNDSGLMHLAGFLNVPVVGIFGSTSPVWTRPVGSHVTIVETDESCSPCFRRTCRYGHYNCLRGISAERVAELLR